MTCIPGELEYFADDGLPLVTSRINIKVGNLSENYDTIDLEINDFDVYLDINDLLSEIGKESNGDLFIPVPRITNNLCHSSGIPFIDWNTFQKNSEYTRTGIDTRACPVNCKTQFERKCISYQKPYFVTKWVRKRKKRFRWRYYLKYKLKWKWVTECRNIPTKLKCNYNYISQPYIEKEPIQNKVIFNRTLPGGSLYMKHNIGIDMYIDWGIYIDVDEPLSPIMILNSILDNMLDKNPNEGWLNELISHINELETIDLKVVINEINYIFDNNGFVFFKAILDWTTSIHFQNIVDTVLQLLLEKEFFEIPAIQIKINQVHINTLNLNIKDFNASFSKINVLIPDIELNLDNTNLLVTGDSKYKKIMLNIPLTSKEPISFQFPLGTYKFKLLNVLAAEINKRTIILQALYEVDPSPVTAELINYNNSIIKFLTDSDLSRWMDTHLETEVNLFYKFCLGTVGPPPTPPMDFLCANLVSDLKILSDNESNDIKNTITEEINKINIPKINTALNDTFKSHLKTLSNGNITGGPNEIIKPIEEALKSTSHTIPNTIINGLASIHIPFSVAVCFPLP